MRTGKYRVRRSLFGKCVLQAQFSDPLLTVGGVDPSIRVIYWEDVDWRRAPVCLVEWK